MQVRRVIYWNESAGGWYDVETDVSVKNMTAPSEMHPFSKGVQAEAMYPSIDQVQQMIADALYQRAAKTHMYFEQGPDQIVTVAYHREDISNLVFEIDQHTRRLAKLERPWWKRW